MQLQIVFRKENTKNADKKPSFDVKECQISTIKHPNTVWATTQKWLEPFLVTKIMDTTKTECFLNFDLNPGLFTLWGLPAKGIVEAYANRPFFILVTYTTSKQQQFDKDKVQRRVNEDIFTIIGAEAPQKSPDDEQSPPSVVETIRTEEELSPSTTYNQERTNWRKSIVVPDGYSKCKDEIIDILTPFLSMWDEYLGRISTVKHHDDLEKSAIRTIHLASYRSGPGARYFKRSEITDILAMNVIDAAQTEGSSPVVFAPKIDWSFEDLCWLQKTQCRNDSWFVSITKNGVVHRPPWRWTINFNHDANYSYFQIELDPSDSQKTAFTFHPGLYQLTPTQFSLKNALVRTRRFMDIILDSIE